MNQQNIDKYMEKWIPYWVKRLRVPLIGYGRDNRFTNCCAFVCGHYNRNYLWYNSKEILYYKYAKFNLAHLIFHELAHLKYNYVWNCMGKVKAEYLTEKQALVWLKRYYPIYYKKQIKWMQIILKQQPYYNSDKPYYGKAFGKIRAYKS